MKILAIDPGYERVGIAVIDKSDSGREVLLFSECFKTSAKLDFPDRLKLIGDEVDRVILEHNPELLAIEALFFARNTTTALSVAEAKGVITVVAKNHGLDVMELKPNEIKVAVTGYGKATKHDIANMVPKLIDADLTGKIDDEIDAIAIGLSASAIYRK
ncbi:MAG: crossover junction endodeoxyribonuclease RuvC [Candidatus Nomurabacteria bacterium]|nr:crossover junction endodeoxyribonuclease RuvC [Candidatus Nomurabacteria bacterium]